MSLADYQPLRSPVPLGNGNSMDVRGLSLDDVAVLMNQHLVDLERLFDLYEGGVREDAKVLATAQFAIGLTRDAPALVANVIALAAAPDGASRDEIAALVPKARTLPMPVQVEAIKAISLLTFAEAGGAKNFLSSLTNLIAAVAPAANPTDSNT